MNDTAISIQILLLNELQRKNIITDDVYHLAMNKLQTKQTPPAAATEIKITASVAATA